MSVNLKSLIAKLNPQARSALEGAAALCMARTHYDVEIEHYLMKLLDQGEGDLAQILAAFGVDRSRLAKELAASLDKLKSGNARTPAFSPSMVKMLTEGWTLGSIDFGAQQIRTGHAVLALVTDTELRRQVADISKELGKVTGEALRKDFATIVGASVEEAAAQAAGGAGGQPSSGAPRVGGKTPDLDQYTIDLTDRARQGKLDPVLGRDKEIREMVDVLTRRRQNNPILVGEAGVGKTAVVEGFALRVAQGDVPEALKNITLRTLDLGLLQAGAGVKGEFENRLKGIIQEVTSSPAPIILFIDEAHTMIGAGGQAGQGDAANLLKPALARGELRTIAATTWAEYKKYFEDDAALKRRFQAIKVGEPTDEQAMVMMRGVVPTLEQHHNVRILTDAVEAAVRLSRRFIADRQLPDKAVSLLDTACARLALNQSATPGAVEDAERHLSDLDVQRRVLEREVALGADHTERLADIARERAESEEAMTALRTRWQAERDLVQKIRGVRERLEAAGAAAAAAASGAGAGATGNGSGAAGNGSGAASTDALKGELATLTRQLEELQGEDPLIAVSVDKHVIGEVIAGWTGIPLGRMMSDEMKAALDIEQSLSRRLVGQPHALAAIARRVQTTKAGIEDPNKPKGIFLLIGPSGVGKTETALAVADLLYGGEQNMVTLNMSEYKSAEMAMTAIRGAAKGFVGYGTGGLLTEAVRRRPHTVVLLDEIEKAEAAVLEMFFQVFDKGTMTDSSENVVDFKNTMIFLTSNVGTDSIEKMANEMTADEETTPNPEKMAEMIDRKIKPELDKKFQPAFLGRMVVVPYFPLRREVLKGIIRLKLDKVVRRMLEAHRATFTYDDAVVEAIADRCTETASGARNVDKILTNTVLPEVSRQVLERLAERRRVEAVRVGFADGKFVYDVQSPEVSDNVAATERSAEAAAV